MVKDGAQLRCPVETSEKEAKSEPSPTNCTLYSYEPLEAIKTNKIVFQLR